MGEHLYWDNNIYASLDRIERLWLRLGLAERGRKEDPFVTFRLNLSYHISLYPTEESGIQGSRIAG